MARLLASASLPAPPDGGALAWLQVLVGFLLYSVCVGMQYCLGILLSAILADPDILGSAARADASWVSSVESAFFLFGALPCSLIRPTLGIRGTMMLGGLLLVTGALMAAHAPNLPVVVCSMVLFGLGCSFPSTVALTALQAWFSKLRGTASGLVVCGSGFGAMVLGPLLQAQVDAGGWRQAFRCIALVSGVTVLLCALCTVPLVLEAPPLESAAEAATADAAAAAADAAAAARASRLLLRHFEDWPSPEEDALAATPSAEGAAKPTLWQQLCALASNQPFLCFLFFISAYGGAWFSLLAHFNSSCRESGTSADDAALLVTYQGLMNSFGRLSMGYAADKFAAAGIPKLALLQCNVFVMAAATLSLAVPSLQASRAYQVAYALINGGFGGCIPSLQAPIMVDICGLALLPLAFGLLHAVQAPLVLLAPVAAGALRSVSGAWTLTWLLVGALIAVGASALAFMRGLPGDVAPLSLVKLAGLSCAGAKKGAAGLGEAGGAAVR